jgi:hypothetical protein
MSDYTSLAIGLTAGLIAFLAFNTRMNQKKRQVEALNKLKEESELAHAKRQEPREPELATHR